MKLLSTLTVFWLSAAAATAAAAWETLAEFSRPGLLPMAPLVLAVDGNFYTTTNSGGPADAGAVIRVSPAGAATTLVTFSGANGRGPVDGLAIGADGALYGVTPAGGAGGFGTAFKVTTTGTLTTLVSFSGTAGAAPGAGPHALVRHADGNFYGVTEAGGSGGAGTVFKMTPAGAVTTLVNLTGTAGVAKGASPVGALAVNGTTLYGVTKTGGTGDFGTVFSVTTSGTFATLAEFTGTAGAKPGANPAAGLLLNTDGILYGTTEFGGTNTFGTAFKLTTAGAFTLLHTFADATGSQPSGVLVRGSDGQLYGPCAAGGTSGFGAVYKMTTTGTYTVLANFTGETGATVGAVPRAGLAVGADGALYGATSSGGAGSFGTVFKTTTAGVFTSLGSLSLLTGWTPAGAPVVDGTTFLFPMAAGGANGAGTLVRMATTGATSVAAAMGGTAGETPTGSLFKLGADFYGVTTLGGTSDRGTAFKYNSTTGLSLVANFLSSSGNASEAPFISAADGALYGTSREGGTALKGTLYKLTTAGVRTRLTSFTGTAGTPKGAKPRGSLALASNGSFYGATENGGAADAGTLFRLSAAGTLTTLAEFTAGGPRLPRGGLIVGADGLVYGTTSDGGTLGGGTLVRITPATNTWSVIAEFNPATTGSRPGGALLAGADGAVYGITAAGGAAGFGTVWRYTAAGLETLASLTGASGAAPGNGEAFSGGVAFSGGLAFGADGKLYGVVPGGGAGGGGTAFRLTLQTAISAWKQTELGDSAAPDLADPDNDGLPTLLEYALGRHPATPDTTAPAPLVRVYTAGQKFLSMNVTRDPAHNDITLTVEGGDTLSGPWTPLATSANGAPFSGPGYVSGDSPTAGVKNVEVRDTVSINASTRRFLRLHVTR